MSFLPKFLSRISRNRARFIIFAGILLAYPLFISNLATNPPGFYVDESCLAYNGYQIAQTGASEFGIRFPLYFQCFTDGYQGYANPTHIYMLAAMYLFVPASILSARILGATLVFLATLLLGLLAARMSGRRLIGVIVAITAMATPWLFEVSRLVLEICSYPFCIVLFLFFLFNAYKRGTWNLLDSVLIALSIALITYSYTAGRLLGPAFAFGLLIFAISKKHLSGVLRTWAVYCLCLVPFMIAFFSNTSGLTARFRQVTYLDADKPMLTNSTEFISAFFRDLSPAFLVFKGDPLLRHHVQGMGEVLFATFLLSITGLIIVILRHRHDAWWRFVVYGFFISVLPGAITSYRYHSFRLFGMSVFLLVLTIPALSFLFSNIKDEPGEKVIVLKSRRRIVLLLLLILTLVQAVIFQVQFRTRGPLRLHDYDAVYPELLEKALAEPSRPIYLRDGIHGPAYVHALWYGAIKGIDPGNFVHLSADEIPPPNSIVLASDGKCTSCNVISQKDTFILYRTWAGATPSPDEARNILPVVIGKEAGSGRDRFSRPRGIASDRQGNFYVADTGNGRVKKYDSYADIISIFDTKSSDPGQVAIPGGVAVDESGSIYVTNLPNQKLMKFEPTGEFINEWSLGFYGPRDMAFGPNNHLYIVDSGRNRIVDFDLSSETEQSWGSAGSDEGQFVGPGGLTIAGDRIVVIDVGNRRIQVFDLAGTFVRQWSIPGWEEQPPRLPDAAFDAATNTLYVSNEPAKDIIAFDMEGNPKPGIKLDGNEQFMTPSAMCIIEARKRRYLIVTDTEISKVFVFDLGEGNSKE